eukprot:scaffold22929_cov80-Skeletonema_marinoi.AAC.1
MARAMGSAGVSICHHFWAFAGKSKTKSREITSCALIERGRSPPGPPQFKYIGRYITSCVQGCIPSPYPPKKYLGI